MAGESGAANARRPKPVAIWGALVCGTLISLFIAHLALPVVSPVMVLSVAAAQAYLVITYFMPVRAEPFYVAAMLVAGLACLYFLFLGLVPDIVFGPGR
jgi:hypothetical protein